MTKKAIVRVRDVMKRESDIVDGMTSIKDDLIAMKHVETKGLIVDKRVLAAGAFSVQIEDMIVR